MSVGLHILERRVSILDMCGRQTCCSRVLNLYVRIALEYVYLTCREFIYS